MKKKRKAQNHKLFELVLFLFLLVMLFLSSLCLIISYVGYLNRKAQIEQN